MLTSSAILVNCVTSPEDAKFQKSKSIDYIYIPAPSIYSGKIYVKKQYEHFYVCMHHGPVWMNTWIHLEICNLFVNTHVRIKIYREFYHWIIYIANEWRHVRIAYNVICLIAYKVICLIAYKVTCLSAYNVMFNSL